MYLENYAIFIAILWIVGMVIVSSMANKRCYSSLPWILLCLFVTPLVPIFILGCFIQTPEMYAKRYQVINQEMNGEKEVVPNKAKGIKRWWSEGFVPREPEENQEN